MFDLPPIAPPPDTLSPDMDRDEPCGDALDPHLHALAVRAVEAGWTPPEVAAALLNWCVHGIADTFGAEAAREMLDLASETLELRGTK